MREFEYDHGVETDEEGRYRIFGLPSGKYIVSTTIASQPGSGYLTMSDGSQQERNRQNRLSPNMTSVFAPGVLRRSEARVYDIHGGEEIADADLKIDLSGLHAIRGRVFAGEDRHVPKAAMIRINEHGRTLEAFAQTKDDGSFEIDYLPSGTYTIYVMGSPDETTPSNPTEPPKVLGQYQLAKVDVIITGPLHSDCYQTSAARRGRVRWCRGYCG